MLPGRARLRESADFSAVVRSRSGVRVGSSSLVLHAVRRTEREACVSRVGFVVSKSVGGAVVRNRTKRRLRVLMAARLARFASGTDLVLRANPTAARLSFAELGSELDRLVPAVLRRLAASDHRGLVVQRRRPSRPMPAVGAR